MKLPPDEKLLVINQKAGLLHNGIFVTRTSPVLSYMRKWPVSKVKRICRTKGWEMKEMS